MEKSKVPKIVRLGKFIVARQIPTAAQVFDVLSIVHKAKLGTIKYDVGSSQYVFVPSEEFNLKSVTAFLNQLNRGA